MAQFCARVRKRADLPSVSIKDVYQHPTIRSLAAALAPLPSSPSIETALAEVLAEVLQVGQVSVDSHFFNDLGADSMVMAQFCARVRKRTDLPSVSIKDVYQHPTVRSLAAALAPRRAAPPVETALAGGAGRGPGRRPGLGRQPLLRRPRCRLDGDGPVLRAGAEAGGPAVGVDQGRLPAPDDQRAWRRRFPRRRPVGRRCTTSAHPPQTRRLSASPTRLSSPADAALPASTRAYVLCGALQLLFFLGYRLLAALVAVWGFEWIVRRPACGRHLPAVGARSAQRCFLGLCTLPILVKWVLIGRWKPQQIRVWSLAYFRFWLVKTLVRANPLVLFAGSPLYVLYLRALGAKIGRGVAIFSRHVPVCTDLLTIGDGTVIRKDSFFTGYRAHAGVIQTGAGHPRQGRASSARRRCSTSGPRWATGPSSGTPPRCTPGRPCPTASAGTARRRSRPTSTTGRSRPRTAASGGGSSTPSCSCSTCSSSYLPLAHRSARPAVRCLVPQLAALPGVRAPGVHRRGRSTATPWPLSAVLFFGSLLVGLARSWSPSRALLNLFITAGQDLPAVRLPLLGPPGDRADDQQQVLRPGSSATAPTSSTTCAASATTSRQVEQTGSNFGTAVKHDTPFLSSVGSGTVVADGLSIINADFSSTSFRVSRASIGPHNFLGNRIAYPAQGRTGDNCLLATKVMVPIDGPVREGVGLLGSPSFEIPRSVERDSRFDHCEPGRAAPPPRRQEQAQPRHHRLVPAGALGLPLRRHPARPGVPSTSTDAFGAIGGRAGPGAHPRCSRRRLLRAGRAGHHRLPGAAAAGLLDLRPALLAARAVLEAVVASYLAASSTAPRSRTCSGGCWACGSAGGSSTTAAHRRRGRSSPSATTARSTRAASIQCHSQEDGAFKSDRIAIGAGCTLGVGAFVHYGVTMGDGAVLAADSFLMKGEEVPPSAQWGGNPAREMRRDSARPSSADGSACDARAASAVLVGVESAAPRRELEEERDGDAN